MPGKRKQPDPSLPSEAQAKRFDLLSPMLESLYTEIKDLSKKDARTVVNELKIKMINRILVEIKNTLGADPSVEFLDILSEQSLPLTSDAVLILSQFKAAMAQFKEKHFVYDQEEVEHRWLTQENP